VLRQFVTHTHLLVRSEWNFVERSSYKFHVSLSVCLNKTPKSLCAVSWLLKFGRGGGVSKIWRNINFL
jgi:hypothetical protein